MKNSLFSLALILLTASNLYSREVGTGAVYAGGSPIPETQLGALPPEQEGHSTIEVDIDNRPSTNKVDAFKITFHYNNNGQPKTFDWVIHNNEKATTTRFRKPQDGEAITAIQVQLIPSNVGLQGYTLSLTEEQQRELINPDTKLEIEFDRNGNVKKIELDN